MKTKKGIKSKIFEFCKLAVFGITVVFVLLVFFYGAIKIGEYDNPPRHHHYAMTTKVIKVDKPTGTITIQDFNGNLWQFKGIKDWWTKGAICSCIMDDNRTDSIKDDKIISVHYDGQFEDWRDFF